MMKQLIFISVIAFVFAANSAFAACSGTPVTGQDLFSLLDGKTVCVAGCIDFNAPADQNDDVCVTDLGWCEATYGKDEDDKWGWDPVWCWQEEHATGGTLIDYKDPGGSKPEPSKVLGTWAVNQNTNIVTYNYTSWSGIFTVYLNSDGTTYTFCNGSGGADIEVVTVQDDPGC